MPRKAGALPKMLCPIAGINNRIAMSHTSNLNLSLERNVKISFIFKTLEKETLLVP
jgi:hypothetical protein